MGLLSSEPTNVKPAVPADDQPRLLRVFLCHSSGDKPAVRDLYRRLRADGFQPWLDEEELLPGQDWDHEIRRAVRAADAILVCLSCESVTKAGYVQKEIRFALDVADEQPEGTIFLIPLKLEECEIPERLRRWQWVDLFEEEGYERLLRALRVRAETLGVTLAPSAESRSPSPVPVAAPPAETIPDENAKGVEPPLLDRGPEQLTAVGGRGKADTLTIRKKQNLEKHLASLHEEYDAAFRQLDQVLSQVDKEKIERQIKALEEDIKTKQYELRNLESAGDDLNRRPLARKDKPPGVN
jgi:hypothetical protein